MSAAGYLLARKQKNLLEEQTKLMREGAAKSAELSPEDMLMKLLSGGVITPAEFSVITARMGAA